MPITLLVLVSYSHAQTRYLSLEEALRLAQDLNADVAAARHQERGAKAREGLAMTGFLPAITASANYTRQTGNFVPRPGLIPSSFHISTSPSNKSYNYYNFSLSLQQQICDFGRTLKAYETAQAQTEAARMDLDMVWQQTWFSVVTQYLAVAAAQEMVKVAQKALDRAKEYALMVKAAVQAGTRQEIEALRAESEMLSAEAGLLQAKNALTLAKAGLLAAIGVQEPFAFEVREPEIFQEEPGSLEEGYEQALRNRPERKALLARVAAQEALVASTRAQWFPMLVGNASFSDVGVDINNLVWNWSVGVSLNMTFAGLAPLYQTREAEAGLAALRERLRGLDVALQKEVEQAWATLEDAKARIEPLQASVDVAKRALELAVGRYAAGLGTYVEVLDSQAALAAAEAALVRGQLELALAKAMWLRATGQIPSISKREER